jgi:hypothetical protein
MVDGGVCVYAVRRKLSGGRFESRVAAIPRAAQRCGGGDDRSSVTVHGHADYSSMTPAESFHEDGLLWGLICLKGGSPCVVH